MKYGVRISLSISFAAALTLAAGLINTAELARFGAAMDDVAGMRFASSRDAETAKSHVQSIQSGILRALLASDPGTRTAALEALDTEAKAFYDALDSVAAEDARLRKAGPATATAGFAEIREDFQRYYLYAGSILDQGAAAMRDPAILARFGALERNLVQAIDRSFEAISADFAGGLASMQADASRATGLAIAMILGSTAFAAAYAWILSRSLSRPIRTLAATAERFGRGDLAARSGWRSRDEFGTLSETFDTMAEGIAALTSGLEEKVRERTAELEAANASLDAALADLRESESRTLLAEKMAALGRLAAGVAHEVNTPVAAIASSVDELDFLLAGGEFAALRGYAGLGDGGRALFERLVLAFESSFDLSDYPDSRATRAARKAAASRLLGEGVAGDPGEAEILAATLSDLFTLDLLADILPLLRDEEGRRALDLAAAWCQGQRSARIIAAAAEKAASVVRTLRFYSADAEERDTGVVDLGLQAAGVVSLFRDAERKGVRFVVDAPEGFRVAGRPDELGRVLVNLVDNAVQAVCCKGEVAIRVEGRDGLVLLTVADDGPGIPEEIRGRIFEPFFTTKRQGEGNGLGLDFAKRVVEAHGGSIGFSSVPGRTVFTVSLPEAGPGPVA